MYENKSNNMSSFDTCSSMSDVLNKTYHKKQRGIKGNLKPQEDFPTLPGAKINEPVF